ncbi:MAG TPA: outer membrane protein assembly factor BamD [Casimicrobiaceae bacterium]|nr:outer membrane protein assembly factor BamD [Casimicrobiaceae bacterium]
MTRNAPSPMRESGTVAHRFARTVATVALALALPACNLFPEVKDETAGWSAERFYTTAHDELISGNYTRAIKLFETLEARYPYGRYAQQALLEGAYANYRGGETTTAVAAADRFIRSHPNHPSVDYAYYLKGLVHFREDQGLLGYLYETDLSERDPKAMKESFIAFKELAEKFPESRYAEDAKTRMRYLSNALGMHEVHVARYYYNRGAYLAAANRAQASLVSYPAVPANEDALDLLVRSYEKLGLKDLATDSKRILEKTYPNSRHLTSGAAAKPWWRFW